MTGKPSVAAFWAMPLPMLPAPMTARVRMTGIEDIASRSFEKRGSLAHGEKRDDDPGCEQTERRPSRRPRLPRQPREERREPRSQQHPRNDAAHGAFAFRQAGSGRRGENRSKRRDEPAASSAAPRFEKAPLRFEPPRAHDQGATHGEDEQAREKRGERDHRGPW